MRPEKSKLVERAGPVFLALLVCVGQIKGNPAFSWVPIDLTAFVAAIVAILAVAARLQYGPTTGRIAFPWILWVLFVLPIAGTEFYGFSITKIGILFTVTLILAVAPFQLLRDEEQRRVFLTTTAVTALFFALTALFLDPTYSAEYSNRIVLEGANTIGTARVAMSGAIVMIFYAFRRDLRGRTRLVLLAAALLTAMLGVLTGSRGPAFAAVITVLTVVVLAPQMQRFRGRALAGFAVVGVTVIWMAMASQSDGLARIVNGSETSNSARAYMWEQSVAVILNNPFGIGWGMYSAFVPQHDYPHNFLLEVGVEAGWLPLLAVTVFLLATGVRGILIATNPTTTALFALYVFAVINAMVSGDINGNRLLWVAMFALWVVPIPGRTEAGAAVGSLRSFDNRLRTVR